jgi:CDP-glucose 4,6-dehydratase
VNPTFWRDKRVLVTGHTGFKGSWLALWLQTLGAQVVGYSLPAPTEPSLFDLAEVPRGILNVNGDVRDLPHLQSTLADARAEIVIHMAAQSLVRRSYAQPVETYETNVLGTVNVLEAVRQTGGVRAVVVVTSDKCYENREWVWGYREGEPMGGHDPYSSSKGCAELVTAAYRNSFFNAQGDGDPASGDHQAVTAVASARAGNVIGGGDWAEDRLVPDIMRAVLANKAVVIRQPDAVRPWQHVLDPLAGYLLLAEKLYGADGARYADAWNFGPAERDAKPVRWLVERITKAWGDGARWELDAATSHPHEAHYLKLDCSKANVQLGWQPRWHIAQALDATVAWYKAYQAKQNVRDMTIAQINSYQATQAETGAGA